jgi:hypothetical protein
MAAETVLPRASEPSFVKKVEIRSNKEGSIDVANGVVTLNFYESILQDTIKATVVFNDAGDSIEGKTALDGLPIVGQEQVSLEFEDNNGVSIGSTKKLIMYVNKVTPIIDESTKSMVKLDLVSKEYILNEKIRVAERFDGKVSDHIKKIYEEQTYFDNNNSEFPKELDIEETQNTYNFIGNNRKPYYLLNWLSQKSIPAGGEGKTAGFITYETSDGFHFKSIDSLMDKEKNKFKKSLIYTNSAGEEIPAGYDMRILEYEKDNAINAQEKLQLGAYDTRIVTFNPFDCYYEVVTGSADNTKDAQENANSAASQPIKHAGKELPTMNEEFNRTGDRKNFSRTTYFYLDVGSLPGRTESDGSGEDVKKSTDEQLTKSKEENFKYKQIVNQSVRRYNQLYSSKMTITIPGDFSLHIGNSLFIDVPISSKEKDDDVNAEDGGLYIIVDLCHYLSAKGTYTKLNLVRDSVGREGNHLQRS